MGWWKVTFSIVLGPLVEENVFGGGGGESGRLGRRSRDSKQPKSIAWRVSLFGLYIRKKEKKKVFKKRVVDGG